MFPQLFHLGKYAIPTYGVLVATGVLVGCLPLFVIFAVPAIYQWQPVQHLLKESFFLKTYAPLAAQVVPPPKKR